MMATFCGLDCYSGGIPSQGADGFLPWRGRPAIQAGLHHRGTEVTESAHREEFKLDKSLNRDLSEQKQKYFSL
jgi:hypothetical protein